MIPKCDHRLEYAQGVDGRLLRNPIGEWVAVEPQALQKVCRGHGLPLPRMALSLTTLLFPSAVPAVTK